MANPYMNYQQPYQPYMTQPYGQQPYPNAAWQQPNQQLFQTAVQPNPQPSQPAFLCIPVTSRAEAEAQRVEAFGPAFIMPDPGHNVIYYKRFNNNTALADFIEFRAVQNQDEQHTANISQIDFNAVLGAIGSFNNRFDAMGEKLDSIASRIDVAYQTVEPIEQPEPIPAPAPRKGGAKK